MPDPQNDPNSSDPILSRNQAWAIPGSYTTALSPSQESDFQSWAKANPDLTKEELSSPTPDYDVRGRWLAEQQGDPDAKLVRSDFDGKLHANDKWKTPYHRTFSAESIYATKDAPTWQGNKLVDKNGNVVADETPGKIQPESDWDANDYTAHGLEVPAFLKGIQKMDNTQIAPPAAGNPNPAAPPTNELGAPTQPAAPANELGQQMPQQAPQQQPAPTMDHDTLFGKAAKMLMGNNTSYSVGPDGKTVTTQTPNTPGSFFKNILAAAVLGGAAGANSNGSFVQGAAQGGAAAMENNQKQDLIKRQQAQEDFKNNQEADRATQQKMLTDATVANMHSEMASRQMHNDMESQEQHERHNQASSAMEDTLLRAGAVPGQLPIDGKLTSVTTAPSLAAAISKDPSLMKAPEGFTRHFVDTADLSDITFNGVNWHDASGAPVNMTDKTTVKAYDVPDASLTKKIPVSGSDYNKARGQNLLDAKKTYQLSPTDMADANTNRLKEDKEQAVIDLEKKKVNMQGMQIRMDAMRLNHEFNSEKKNEFTAAARMVSENIKSLQAQAKDPLLDPKLKAHLNDQINQANGQLKQYYEKAYPDMKVDDLMKAQDESPSGAVAHPEIISILKDIPNFSADVASKIANMSPEAIHDQLVQSSLPIETKNKIMKAIGQPSIEDPNAISWDQKKVAPFKSAASAVSNVLKNIQSPL